MLAELRNGAGRVLLALLVLTALTAGSYAALSARWADRWGTTPAEAAGAMPGDGLVQHPVSQSTRAVSIDAPADGVWAWLAQFGTGRGGLYSYDMAERLAGVNVHNLDRLVPDLQELAVGQTIWVTQQGYPANLVFKVAQVEPGHALVLAFTKDPAGNAVPADPGWTWSFQVQALGPTSTRLVLRDRQASLGNPVADALQGGLVGPIGFVMERKTLLGIKDRAERQAGTASGATGDGWLFALLALGAVGAVGLATTRRWPVWQRLAAGSAAAIVLGLVVIRGYPHPSLALMADVAIAGGVGAAYGLAAPLASLVRQAIPGRLRGPLTRHGDEGGP